MTCKKQVLDANKWIVEKKLVELTWGNVSYFDRNQGKIYIKPSGVNLAKATPDDVSEITLDGRLISGKKPSVDTPTHLEIYKNFDRVDCVIHTHSKYCTIFAQSNISIPCLGTTHADYFYGDIPCIDHTDVIDTSKDYERNTGKNICEHYKVNKINPLYVGVCLVKGHGVFCWGKGIEKTLERAFVSEALAEMAYKTLILNPCAELQPHILDKHFLRKHGDKKYYGQE